MNMLFEPNYLRLISPELILTSCAFLLLGLATVKDRESKAWTPALAVLSCLVTLMVLLALTRHLGLETLRVPDLTIGFNGMFILDAFSVFFKMIFLIAAILTILISDRYLELERAQAGEYYALILFAVVGMMFMASAGDFITIFVSLETMALSFYVLVGFLKANRKSNEAALKYFLLGSFSTGIFLYGVSLVYATTATTNLGLIGASRSLEALQPDRAPIFLLGVILVTVALGFKIAAVPFHMWVPDAYEGAPTPVTAFLSTGSKAAAFVVLVRVFTMGFARLGDRWAMLLAILAVASMTLGNVAAILQDNVKRMLAYSSIAHAGYVLLGLIAAGAAHDVPSREFGLEAVLLYLLIYTFVNIGGGGAHRPVARATGGDRRLSRLHGHLRHLPPADPGAGGEVGPGAGALDLVRPDAAARPAAGGSVDEPAGTPRAARGDEVRPDRHDAGGADGDPGRHRLLARSAPGKRSLAASPGADPGHGGRVRELPAPGAGPHGALSR